MSDFEHPGHVETCSGHIVSGWTWDPKDPARRRNVEIYVENEHVATLAADRFRQDLLDARVGDGAYGFFFQSSVSLEGKVVFVNLADSGEPLDILDVSYSASLKEAASSTGDQNPASPNDEVAVIPLTVPPAGAVFEAGRFGNIDFAARKDDIARLFDAKWYLAKYPDVRGSGLDPLTHFLSAGAREGRDPNLLFDSAWYVRHNLSAAKESVHPLLHYIDGGIKAKLRPHPLFHVEWYSNQFPDLARSAKTPLEHYLAVGSKTGMAATPLFDSNWYVKACPQAKGSGLNPFLHYLGRGWSGGYSANPYFDVASYVMLYPELANSGENPLVHYLEIGAANGSDPSPNFSTLGYLKAYPDIQRAKINPLEHFMRSGQKEGRSPLGKEDTRAAVNSRVPIFSRYGGVEYGPIEKVLAFSSQAELPELSLRVCVHIHLFHGDLAEEFIHYLSHIPVDFTLLVSVRADDRKAWRRTFMSRLHHVTECVVKRVENIGRDVAPWVVSFAGEILEHDVFFHAHTKKSDYNAKFFDWRWYLLHNTIGSRSVVGEILGLFSSDKGLGLVYPAYFSKLNAQPAWGASRDKAAALAERMGVPPPPARCPSYPGGSFFWARVDYLRPLLTCGLTNADFDSEADQIDGTLAHAIERMLGDLTRSTGLTKICATVDVGYNLIDFWDTKRAEKLPNRAIGEKPSYKTKVEPLNDKRKIAVFTCVTGGFDETAKPLIVHPDVDYFMFSDVELPEFSPYRTVVCQYRDVNPRRTARFIKTHPHLLLREYDLVIWIDANILLKASLAPFIDIVDDADADLGVVFHTVRTSYAEEAEECALIGADDKDILKEQVEKYSGAGIPAESLIETNFMIAKLDRPKVKEFFNAWWREMTQFSVRDQVSVNYAAHSAQLKIVPILPRGRSVRDDGRFLIFEHKVKQREGIVDSVLKGGSAGFAKDQDQ